MVNYDILKTMVSSEDKQMLVVTPPYHLLQELTSHLRYGLYRSVYYKDIKILQEGELHSINDGPYEPFYFGDHDIKEISQLKIHNHHGDYVMGNYTPEILSKLEIKPSVVTNTDIAQLVRDYFYVGLTNLSPFLDPLDIENYLRGHFLNMDELLKTTKYHGLLYEVLEKYLIPIWNQIEEFMKITPFHQPLWNIRIDHNRIVIVKYPDWRILSYENQRVYE